MRRLFQAALPLAAMLAAPTVLMAQPQAPEITVVAPVEEAALRHWVGRTEQAISRELRAPHQTTGRMDEGIVAVRFKCSEDGRPASIALVQPSGSSQLDRAALRTIRNVKSLHPLPEGIGPEQMYEARLLYVSSGLTAPELRSRMAALASDAQRANAAALQHINLPVTAARVTLLPAAVE